jgi:hypothetical protein
MCVIAISPVGVNAPTEQNLKDMFKHNDDGAGISFVLDKAVYTYKGLMKWADFEKTYALIEKKLRTAGKTFNDVPIMYHFRIGTHGPNSEALTHPFPISNQFKHLTALEYKSDVVMAHNGIIHSVVPRAGWSDTQQYISDIIMPLIKTDRHFYKNKHLQELMRNTNNGSRFAFLDMDGNFTTVGEWVESDLPDLKGILYSNLNHEYTYTYGHYYPTAYNWDYGLTPTKESVYAAPVPKGAKLYSAIDLADDFIPLSNGKSLTVSTEKLYWADEYGELYRMDDKTGFIYPIFSFDYAFVDDELFYSTDTRYSDTGELLPIGSGTRVKR